MKCKIDPERSQGTQIWERLETLRYRFEAACSAFDELYGYIYTLKEENRKRAEKDIATPKQPPPGDAQRF
jgi:hypothetical protein